MGASTAPAVKAQLLTLLRADAGLTGVGIDYADPGAAIQEEAIFYGKTIETEVPAPGLGQRRQREAYDIEVYIYAKVDGDDPQTTEERCWALVARLESIVRANNQPSGQLTNQIPGGGWVVYGGTEMTPFAIDGARVAEALCRVHVDARKMP